MVRTEKENGFIKGTVILTLSVFIVKLIGYLYKLPLSHILGDEGMGYFNSAYSIFGFFYMLSLGGVPRAITICVTEARVKSGDKEAQRILFISLRIFLAIGIAFAALLMSCSSFFAKIIGNSMAKLSLFCIAPSLTFVSAAGVLRGYLNGMKRVSDIAVAEILDGVSKFVTGLALALFAARKNASAPVISAYTVLGVSIGAFVGSLFLFICAKTRKTNENIEQKCGSVATPYEIIGKIFKISIPITISSAVMGATNIIDLGLIMQRLKSMGVSETDAVALYGNFTTLVVPLLSLVSAFITPLATASIPHIAASRTLGKQAEYYDLLRQILSLTAVVTIPIAFAYSFFSFDILKLLFNDASAKIASPLLILSAPSVFFSAMLVMSNTVLESSGFPRAPLISMGLGAIAKILSAYILIGRIGIFGAPVSTTVCYVVSFFVSAFILHRKLRFKLSVVCTAGVPIAVSSLLFAIGSYVYHVLFVDNESTVDFLVFSAVIALIYLVFSLFYIRKNVINLTNYVTIAKKTNNTL